MPQLGLLSLRSRERSPCRRQTTIRSALHTCCSKFCGHARHPRLKTRLFLCRRFLAAGRNSGEQKYPRDVRVKAEFRSGSENVSNTPSKRQQYINVPAASVGRVMHPDGAGTLSMRRRISSSPRVTDLCFHLAPPPRPFILPSEIGPPCCCCFCCCLTTSASTSLLVLLLVAPSSYPPKPGCHAADAAARGFIRP